MRLPRALDTSWQRMVAGAWRFVPPAVGIERLGPVRARIVDEVFERRRADVERAQERYLEGRGAEELSRVAEALLSEARSEMARAGDSSWQRLAARLDARLPTSAMEHMDDPSFSAAERTEALRTLDGWNRRAGSYALFLSALEPLLGPPDAPITVLDLASGHGGFPLALAALTQRTRAAHGARKLEIISSDLRPEYVAIGRQHAAESGFDVDFRVVDAFHLGDSIAKGEVDIITSTQSLHHFGAGGVTVLLAEALRHARRGVLFVDLARAVSGLLAIGAVTGLLSDRTYFHDAVVSVRKAFVPEELRLLARCAPGGAELDAFSLPPAFVALRSPIVRSRSELT